MLVVIGRLDGNGYSIDRVHVHQIAGINTASCTCVGTHRHVGTRSVTEIHIQTELELHLGRVVVFVRRSGLDIGATVRSRRVTQYVKQHDVGRRRGHKITAFGFVTHHVRPERLVLDIIPFVLHRQVQRPQGALTGLYERHIVHGDGKQCLAVRVHPNRLNLRVTGFMQAVVHLQFAVLDTHLFVPYA